MSSILPPASVRQSERSTLAAQAAPIRLAMYLLEAMPDLPTAAVNMSAADPGKLGVSLHHRGIGAFDEWRAALGLPAPTPHRGYDSWWLDTSGTVQDCRVELTAHENEATVRAYALLPDRAQLLSAIRAEQGLAIAFKAADSPPGSVTVETYRWTDPVERPVVGGLTATSVRVAADQEQVRLLVADGLSGLAALSVAAGGGWPAEALGASPAGGSR